MNLFTFLISALCFTLIVAILVMIYRIVFPPIIVEQPVYVSNDLGGWWPWSITAYNYWPSWLNGDNSSNRQQKQQQQQQQQQSQQQQQQQQHHQSRPWGGSGRGANGGGFHSSHSSGGKEGRH